MRVYEYLIYVDAFYKGREMIQKWYFSSAKKRIKKAIFRS